MLAPIIDLMPVGRYNHHHAGRRSLHRCVVGAAVISSIAGCVHASVGADVNASTAQAETLMLLAAANWWAICWDLRLTAPPTPEPIMLHATRSAGISIWQVAAFYSPVVCSVSTEDQIGRRS